jgi:hypothetical protein
VVLVTREVRETQGQPATVAVAVVVVPCSSKVMLAVIPGPPEVRVTVAAVVLVVLVARVVRAIPAVAAVRVMRGALEIRDHLQPQFPELSRAVLGVTVETAAVLVLGVLAAAEVWSIVRLTAPLVVVVAEAPVEIPEAVGAFSASVLAAPVGVAVAPAVPVGAVIAGLGLAEAAAVVVVLIRALPVIPEMLGRLLIQQHSTL